MKELLEEIKLSKVAYLVEKIEKRDLEEKIKYYRKLEKMKITKKIGLYLIENSKKDFKVDDDYGGISSSLIELCFKNFDIEYLNAIDNVFADLNNKAQDRVLYLLTTRNEKEALILYSELIIKFYKNRNNIPIGELANKPLAYPYLFPKLIKALRFNIKNNNVLILINSYLNAGVFLKTDLNKNKKIIIDYICKLFERALKYKHKNTYEYLNDLEYKELRYFLEISINIETYINSNKLNFYFKKLLKKKDNQLKLFILDNYIRGEKDLKNFDFETILKDKASRYALFELLSVYEKIDLMPKKYLNKKQLSESDFYTNFVITTSYTTEPKKLKFNTIVKFNNLEYYVYKFEYKNIYSSNSQDYLTNYINNQIGLDKYNGNLITNNYIGISGGFDPNKDYSIINNDNNILLISKVDNDKNIEEIAIKLLEADEQRRNNIKIELEEAKEKEETTLKKQISKDDKLRIKEEKKKERELKKEEKRIKKEEEKQKKALLKEEKNKLKEEKKIRTVEEKQNKKISKEEKQRDKEIEKIIKDEKKNKINKEIVIDNIQTNLQTINEQTEEFDESEKKSHNIFSYILLFFFAVFIGLLIYCMLYIYGIASFNDGVDDTVILPAKIKNKGDFTEILGHDIFNQMENEYFVLLYTGTKKEENNYYRLINEYTKRKFKFYYVDLNNSENKFLYGPNDLNFTVYTDRLLKVKDKEYEYYVDNKTNILNEMQTQINEIIAKEKEEEKLKAKEKAQEEIKKLKKQNNEKDKSKTKKKEDTNNKNKTNQGYKETELKRIEDFLKIK